MPNPIVIRTKKTSVMINPCFDSPPFLEALGAMELPRSWSLNNGDVCPPDRDMVGRSFHRGKKATFSQCKRLPNPVNHFVDASWERGSRKVGLADPADLCGRQRQRQSCPFPVRFPRPRSAKDLDSGLVQSYTST